MKNRFYLHECPPPPRDPGRWDMLWSVLIVGTFFGLALLWLILR